MLQDFFLVLRVLQVLEGYLLALPNSRMDIIDQIVDSLVICFYPCINVELSMEDLALVWPDKGRELFDQLLALLGGNESGRLNRINEQLNFCKLENPHIKKVAILCTSLAVNIHSERNQIVYVARYSLS